MKGLGGGKSPHAQFFSHSLALPTPTPLTPATQAKYPHPLLGMNSHQYEPGQGLCKPIQHHLSRQAPKLYFRGRLHEAGWPA